MKVSANIDTKIANKKKMKERLERSGEIEIVTLNEWLSTGICHVEKEWN